MLQDYKFNGMDDEYVKANAWAIKDNKLLWAIIEDMEKQFYLAWLEQPGGNVKEREVIAAEARCLQAIKAVISNTVANLLYEEGEEELEEVEDI